MYRNDNPDLPSLEPWILKTRPPADRIVFERNPYYYRVDGAGHQLPYIDRVVLTIANSKIIPAKTGAGESDLQARYLSFDDYTFLKAGEAENGYQVRLWRTGPGSQLALYPEPQRQRRGLARAGARRAFPPRAVARHRPPRDQPGDLFRAGDRRPEHGAAAEPALSAAISYRLAAQYDLAEANRLLDEIGLEARQRRAAAPAGRPDRSRSSIENSGELSEKSDVLELIRDSWREIGIRLFSRPMQLTLFRRRVFAGETLMSLDKGIENGLATADMSPWEFAPTAQQQLEWPKWGQFMETKGTAGERPDLPEAVRLQGALRGLARRRRCRGARPDLARNAADLGRTRSTRSASSPACSSRSSSTRKLRNVPAEGMYNWDPGAHFGIYKPDGFWFDQSATPAASAALTPREPLRGGSAYGRRLRR